MKNSGILLMSVLLLHLFFSCKKSNDSKPEPEKPPERVSITSISPDSNALHTGANVFITGKYFGTDTSRITLTLGNQRLPIIRATNDSIIFTVPFDLTQPGGQTQFLLTVAVTDKGADSRNVSITWQEPRGWYYQSIITWKDNRMPFFKQIKFVTDSIGFAQQDSYIYRSTDGGRNWLPSPTISSAFGFDSYDGKNAWTNFGSFVGVSSDGVSYSSAAGARYFDNSVMGLYMSSPVNGLVASTAGRLYKINGGFQPAQTSLIYESPYALPSTAPFLQMAWQNLSVLDESNLMVVGFKVINGTPTNTIVHEKAGVFDDYDLSSLGAGGYGRSKIQLIDANTAILIDAYYNMYKWTGNRNWTKLNQKAVEAHFINANTGYAFVDSKIIKTTDGGATWKDEFYFAGYPSIYGFCSKNGKLWAIGNDAKGGIVLKCNP